jgi:hypothetical protein
MRQLVFEHLKQDTRLDGICDLMFSLKAMDDRPLLLDLLPDPGELPIYFVQLTRYHRNNSTRLAEQSSRAGRALDRPPGRQGREDLAQRTA